MEQMVWKTTPVKNRADEVDIMREMLAEMRAIRSELGSVLGILSSCLRLEAIGGVSDIQNQKGDLP